MCAAPLRPRAAFCHRCGKPYPEESAVVYKSNESLNAVPTTEEFDAQWNTLTSNNGDASLQIAETENSNAVSHAPQTNVDESGTNVEKPTEKSEDGSGKIEKKRLSKRRIVQTTEYVWEERKTDPTWRFALARRVSLISMRLIRSNRRFLHF